MHIEPRTWFILATFSCCFFLSMLQRYSISPSVLKKVGSFFDRLKPRLSAGSLHSVSRGCLLWHGGFWRSRASSSEPERKGEGWHQNLIFSEATIFSTSVGQNASFPLSSSCFYVVFCENKDWFMANSNKSCKALRCSWLKMFLRKLRPLQHHWMNDKIGWRPLAGFSR